MSRSIFDNLTSRIVMRSTNGAMNLKMKIHSVTRTLMTTIQTEMFKRHF